MILEQPQGQEEGAEQQQGFVIEIACLPDGTFNVSSEPLQQEAGEDNANPESGAGQTVGSFQEAIKAAMEIYQNGGDQEGGEDDFAAGFGGDKPSTVMEG